MLFLYSHVACVLGTVSKITVELDTHLGFTRRIYSLDQIKPTLLSLEFFLEQELGLINILGVLEME